MRVSTVTTASVLLAIGACTGTTHRGVVVSYPSDTPNGVLEEAMAAVRREGGKVTHEYTLIKAFAAEASDAALKLVTTMGSQYNALIEDDKPVKAIDKA